MICVWRKWTKRTSLIKSSIQELERRIRHRDNSERYNSRGAFPDSIPTVDCTSEIDYSFTTFREGGFVNYENPIYNPPMKQRPRRRDISQLPVPQGKTRPIKTKADNPPICVIEMSDRISGGVKPIKSQRVVEEISPTTRDPSDHVYII